MGESQNIEYKESWRDEYLKWICGFANSQGGILYVGIKDNGKICGVSDSKKLMEDLPRMNSAVLNDSTENVLENLNLVDENKKLTNAAILLFGKDPAKYFPLCDFRIGRRGIDKICDCLKNAKMKAPVFESNCGGVLLTIYRKNNFVSSEGTEFTVLESSENRPDNSQKTAQKTAQKILDYLAENPTATIVDLQAVLNKANGTIKEHITKLKQSGRLERVGGDNGGYWKVMNNVE